MSRIIKNVITFKVVSIFEDSAKIFEIKEADLIYSEFDIKLLIRDFSKADPKKVICINQAPDGKIQKFFQANSKWTKSYKVNFLTMEE